MTWHLASLQSLDFGMTGCNENQHLLPSQDKYMHLQDPVSRFDADQSRITTITIMHIYLQLIYIQSRCLCWAWNSGTGAAYPSVPEHRTHHSYPFPVPKANNHQAKQLEQLFWIMIIYKYNVHSALFLFVFRCFICCHVLHYPKQPTHPCHPLHPLSTTIIISNISSTHHQLWHQRHHQHQDQNNT